MFDLFRSREKSVRLLLGALLVLVALSMLTYLIPSYGDGSSAGDTVVATIGKDAVTTIDVQRTLQNMVKGKQLPPELMGTYVPQIIEGMVTERALAYEADRLGYHISDADLAQAIQQMAPALFQDGKFVGKDTYAAMLAQQNVTIAEFESELKRSLLITRLRSVAGEGVIVAPAEIEREYKRRSEKAKVEYVKLTGEKFRAEVPVTDEEIRKTFEARKDTYRVPEKKSLAILVADQARLEQTVTPADADLQRLYTQNRESFRTPDRVKVRHILLKTSEKPAEEDAKMKAKAEDLLKKIKAGGNFAELAKANSEDTGSAKNGGELPDWVAKGQTVPEFEKAAFSLPVGQTSDIVKTQYGYHILQVLQKEQARVRPFEEVKQELAAQWKKQRVSDLMDQASSRGQAALVKEPGNPEKIASEFNLQLVKAEDVAPDSPLPEIGVSKDFEESLSGVKKGEVTPPVALPGNKIAFAVVTGVTPARPSTLEEVRVRVRESIVDQKLAEVVAKKADELAEKAKSMGDLKKAAQAMKLDFKAPDEFTRTGAVEGLGTAAYLEGAFTSPVGTLLGPLSVPDGKAVVKVTGHTAADMAQFAAQRSTIRDEIKSRKARDRAQLFEAGLRQSLIQKGKIKLHQDVINRLVGSYRSGGA